MYDICHDRSLLYLSKQVEGESDLHHCKPYEVCNVVHDRFWVSGLTERLCRCPDGQKCPWQWTKIIDNSSLSLNNKSILKVQKY